MGGPAKLLLADVEIEALQDATLPTGFIPGRQGVVANYGGRFDLDGGLAFGMPGANWTTSLDVGPGFAYRGTMVWVAPDNDVRITIDARRRTDGEGPGAVQFSYLARDGVPDPWIPRTPEPSSDPAATPTTGVAELGDTVILAADGGTMPLAVRGVEQAAQPHHDRRDRGDPARFPAAPVVADRAGAGRGSGHARAPAGRGPAIVTWVLRER
jgi:hypothetical protein